VETTEVVERDRRPWWLRLRSAFLLALFLLVLGVATAVLLGVLALAVTSILDQALG